MPHAYTSADGELAPFSMTCTLGVSKACAKGGPGNTSGARKDELRLAVIVCACSLTSAKPKSVSLGYVFENNI